MFDPCLWYLTWLDQSPDPWASASRKAELAANQHHECTPYMRGVLYRPYGVVINSGSSAALAPNPTVTATTENLHVRSISLMSKERKMIPKTDQNREHSHGCGRLRHQLRALIHPRTEARPRSLLCGMNGTKSSIDPCFPAGGWAGKSSVGKYTESFCHEMPQRTRTSR
ncbi:hypothetical protein BDV18DRAFT_38496 [Aspergillus unguis]